MASISSTRLKVLRAKDLEVLLASVNVLSYKIEIKGNPVFSKGKWVLFYVPPDEDRDDLRKVPLIVDLD